MKGLYIFDTEADGLCGKSIAPEDHMTKFHVLHFKEFGKDNRVFFLDPEAEGYQEAVEWINAKEFKSRILPIDEFNTWIVEEPAAIACQNLEGYDMKAFKSALGTEYVKLPKEMINGKEILVYDTLSMSRGLHPDRPMPRGCPSKVKNPLGGPAKTIGPHSLQAWGHKVANAKVEIEDWRNLPLWKYCDRVVEDVVINELQWMHLVKEMSDGASMGINWKVGLRNNLLSDHLMELQEEQGIVFDEDGAWELLHKVDAWMKEIADEVHPQLPMKDVPLSRQPNFPANPFDKAGNIGHHGWSYAKKILGYKLNQEFFDHVNPPKTSFKKDGSVGTHGYNYCIKQGVEDPELMADFIRSQNIKGQDLVPISREEELELRKQLSEKYMPEKYLKEPMLLSNQEDIKIWFVREGKWVPTLFNTKDATRDQFKKQRGDAEISEICWDYIQDKRDSVFEPYISAEMGVRIKNITSPQHKDFKKVLRKARFLITAPKLKDERGDLCPNLDKLNGNLAKQIVKWLSYRNRRAVLKCFDEKKSTGWLNHPRLKKDGRLPARYSGLTNTNRRKHQIVVNVPSMDALIGKEMRSLFKVPDGYWQLGIDGSNLEGMCAAEAAYEFDGGEYYRSLSGDPHTANANAYTEASGTLVTRQGGKGITYGIMYGAQAAKIATMLGVTQEVGQAVIDAFWDTNFGLKGRREALEAYWEKTGKKYIRAIDGRKIWTRSKHSLLNCYLQSSGAIGMDLAGILWHKACLEHGLFDKGVARNNFQHDEYQLEVPDSEVRWKNFSTPFDNRKDVTMIIEAKAKNDKLEKKGKEFKDVKGIAKELGFSTEDVQATLDTHKEVRDYTVEGYVLSGNVRVRGDGAIGKCYSLAGVLMVKAIEDAYVELGFTVPITGEYLAGRCWMECH